MVYHAVLILLGLMLLVGCGEVAQNQGQDTDGAVAATAPAPSERESRRDLAIDQNQGNPSPDKAAQIIAATPGDPNRFALLIGCTKYPNLDERLHLVGPANDVVLARKLLVERFQFPSENVATLSDQSGDMPTRANIERHWQRLADVAKPGMQMVVLMAGHGTQMPQMDDDDGDPEADGLDEVFLPRDAGKWNDAVGEVENAITDDQLRRWVQAINEKGASLWVIIDACHSGTMTRAVGADVRREVPPEALGVPEASIRKARARAARSEGRNGADQPQLIEDDSKQTRSASTTPSQQNVDGQPPTLVALFAAQSIEATVEKRLPQRGANRKFYGLLTYTLNEILSQADSRLTYRELVQQIHCQYVRWGLLSPTPMLEGTGMDNEVLGLDSFPQRSRILVADDKADGWKINAGALSGLTTDSILAVYPPAGEANADELVGHVRVLARGFGAVEARIEPCEYDSIPAPQRLVARMRCQPVYVNLGNQRLRVGVDVATEKGEDLPAALRDEMDADLEQFVDERKHLLQAVDGTSEPDWLLRYDSLQSNKLFLVPASGWPGQQQGKLPPLFGPAPAGDEFFVWLNDALTRIARVKGLLSVAAGSGVQGSASDSGLKVQIVRFRDESDKSGELVRFGRGGIKLYNGDRIAFRVKHEGVEPLDVTLLMIDSAYGIHPLFPQPGTENRLYAGDQLKDSQTRGTIDTTTTGLEHLVVIAVKGKPVDQPIDFTFLAQPQIEKTRALGNASPLKKVLVHSLYGEGEATQGLTCAEVANYEIRVLSWSTQPESRPE